MKVTTHRHHCTRSAPQTRSLQQCSLSRAWQCRAQSRSAAPALHANRHRHILNTLSTFANSMDAQRLSHLVLLEHEGEQVASLGEQMKQCLTGMQGMLQDRVAVAE